VLVLVLVLLVLLVLLLLLAAAPPLSLPLPLPPPLLTPTSQYFETWTRGFRAAKKARKNATIVGPSVANQAAQLWMKRFLTDAAKASVLPDVVSWHMWEQVLLLLLLLPVLLLMLLFACCRSPRSPRARARTSPLLWRACGSF